jgi:hypothetical protein
MGGLLASLNSKYKDFAQEVFKRNDKYPTEK